MLFFILFLLELLTIFLLSKQLIKQLSLLFHRLTKSKILTVYLLAIVFLPGTIIHELAHFIMAKILFVYAGKITLLPRLDGNTIKLGSVLVGKTDPIRRFLIGAAPFFFGMICILGTIYIAIQNNVLEHTLFLVIILYIVFEIGNTMFSSSKDMEGAVTLLFIIGILSTIAYFLGIRLDMQSLMTKHLFILLPKATMLLAIPLILDIIIIGIVRTIIALVYTREFF